MRILAIETSGRDASLALLESAAGGAANVVREAAVTGPERSAQYLAPRLVELLSGAEWPAESIQLIAVAIGPGSFTGLRIGVTTAKTLAYAVGAEVIGVDTLEVIASQAPRTDEPLWAVSDAQRQELFAAKFDPAGGVTSPSQILTQSAWLSALEMGDLVTGPGLKRIRASLPTGVEVVDEAAWQPTAAAVGKLGWRDYAAGRRNDLWQLLPQYYRLSAAEEKRGKGAS
jgi:tRNA threonylcarbamoyladenosine biosynthesis protein TsaB